MHGNATHGLSRTPEHMIWLQIKQRCLNPKNKRFPYYGGRGITICPEWASDFLAFLRDVGKRPRKGLTLDRIDNSKGYEPGNVHWTDWVAQSTNRRSRRWVVLNGEKITVAEASRRLGFKRNLVNSRLHQGMTIEQALTPGLIEPRRDHRQRNPDGTYR